MKLLNQIFKIVCLVCCFANVEQIHAADNFVNVATSYRPVLYVATSLGAKSKDFATPKDFYKWQFWLENKVYDSVQSYHLESSLQIIFKYDSNYEDVFKASHSSDVVGLVLIAHDTSSTRALSGQMLDSMGNALDSALLGSSVNLRALALVSCYSAQNLDSLVALNAFGPYTFKVSYTRIARDTWDIPGSLSSVLRHLDKTKATWQNSKIKDFIKKIRVHIYRELNCESGEMKSLSKIAIRIGEQTVGVMKTFDQCHSTQNMDIDIPEETHQRILLSVKGLLSRKDEVFNLGLLRADIPYEIKRIVSVSGEAIGAPFSNSYNLNFPKQ